MPRVTERQYRQLLEFRVALRRFHKWSESQAGDVGLTPAQHQLLLAVRGHSDQRGPTIGEVAEYLLLRHHSAVELIDRAATAGLVVRVGDPEDGRVIRVQLSALGRSRVDDLGPLHLQELRRLAPLLHHLVEAEEGAAESTSTALRASPS